jgi:hypothetical protein
MDIQVIDINPITREVFFTLKARKVTGMSKLIQIVVLSLLNVPGQDVLSPDKGGGLPSLVGSNIDINDSTELYGEIAQRVRKSETEIITDQIGIDDPSSEKLSELRIIDLKQGETLDQILVRIRVINQEGLATDIVV